MLLYPVVQALPDAISNPIFNIGEEDGKQDQEYCPADENGEEPVRPGHSYNSVQNRLSFRVNLRHEAPPPSRRDIAEHLSPQDEEDVAAKDDADPGNDLNCPILQTLDKEVGRGSILRVGDIDG